jgi:hypothetical protein
LSEPAVPGEVTLDRFVTAEFYTREERGAIRPYWDHYRHASEIARAVSSRYGSSSGVLFVPGDAWIMHPHHGDLSRVVTSSFGGGGAVLSGGGGIRSVDANTAPGVVFENRYRRPDNLAGVPSDPDVQATGDPVIKRRPGADGNFSPAGAAAGNLAADEIAFPPIPTPTAYVNVDRVLQGRVTYPPNCPFALVLFAPEGAPDNLCNFYLGGKTDTDVFGQPGGEFGLNFRANGEVYLWERGSGGDWPAHPAFRFDAGAPGRSANALHSYTLIPYSRDRMVMFSANAQGGIATGPFARVPFAGFDGATKNASLYRESKATAGHAHQRWMTGAGIIRADRARNDRTDLRIVRLVYPSAGSLIDLPFRVPYRCPPNTTLTVNLYAEVPPGTGISATVYDATTNVAVTAGVSTGLSSNWIIGPGQQNYRLTIHFTSADGTQTPVFYGYTLHIDALFEFNDPVTVSLEPNYADGVTVTGGGTDPAQASAHFAVEDLGRQYDFLKAHGRYWGLLKTRYDDDPAHHSVLFAGETAPDGIDQFVHYIEDVGHYSRYVVPMLGAYTRLVDQLNINRQPFYTDPSAAPDPTTLRYPGWKLVDILRWLFRHAGVPDDAIDVDEAKLGSGRLWLGLETPAEDAILEAGVRFGTAIQKIAREYLDAFVIYDPNAGAYDSAGNPRGMWRVLPQPFAPYTPLATFRLGPPTGGPEPALVHHAGTYYTGIPADTFFLRETYRIRMKPPEANYVLAVGLGGVLSNDAGGLIVRQELANPKALNIDPANLTADPDHRDYIAGGRMVPILAVDPWIHTQPGINYYCKRVYDRSCHAKQFHSGRAPLILVTDLNDPHQVQPRPLRAGDAVQVPANEDGTGGFVTAVVADVNQDIPGLNHWADYELVAVNPEAEGA